MTFIVANMLYGDLIWRILPFISIMIWFASEDIDAAAIVYTHMYRDLERARSQILLIEDIVLSVCSMKNLVW